MQIGEKKELTIAEFFDIASSGGTFEIETPDGWKDIGSLIRKDQKQCRKLILSNGRFLHASVDHYVLTKRGWKNLEEIKTTDWVLTQEGYGRVSEVVDVGTNDTFDLEVLDKSHAYWSNGIASHNTGKTALARAFAKDLNMPIFVYNLAEMSNESLRREWQNMQQHVPCIALIEDIDNVFHGRKNVRSMGGFGMGYLDRLRDRKKPAGPGVPGGKKGEEEEGLPSGSFMEVSFDTLLNCLDGVEQATGVFAIITTNDISKIDDALGRPKPSGNGEVDFISTRPGRIDKVIELTYIANDNKLRMAERILQGYPKGMEQMKKFIATHHDLQETPAQFQERCSDVALRLLWKTEHEKDVKALVEQEKASVDVNDMHGVEQQLHHSQNYLIQQEMGGWPDDPPPARSRYALDHSEPAVVEDDNDEISNPNL